MWIIRCFPFSTISQHWDDSCSSNRAFRKNSLFVRVKSQKTHNARDISHNAQYVHISVTKWCIVVYLMHCGISDIGLYHGWGWLGTSKSTAMVLTLLSPGLVPERLILMWKRVCVWRYSQNHMFYYCRHVLHHHKRTKTSIGETHLAIPGNTGDTTVLH